MIDLIDKDILISDMQEDVTYLVGKTTSRVLYMCKRRGSDFYYIEFSFNLSHLLCRHVIDGTHVVGIERKSKELFEETLKFNQTSVKELIFNKIAKSTKIKDKPYYIMEYLSAESADFYK